LSAQLDLVLQPVVVPKKGTQCGDLLRAMQEGVRLTIWNAMTEYGCGALHQRIGELKDMGWPVKRDEITQNGKRYAVFWMESH
jgi:hypothetical protein